MESKAGFEGSAASSECPHLFHLGLASPSCPGSSKWSAWGCQPHARVLRGSALHTPPAQACLQDRAQACSSPVPGHCRGSSGTLAPQEHNLLSSSSAQEGPAQKSELWLQQSKMWSGASQVFKLGWWHPVHC